MAASEPVNKVILLKSKNGTDFTEAGLMKPGKQSAKQLPVHRCASISGLYILPG
ncbi:MAG: hypothetical protein IPG38_02440 [Chitinophagaceae bacterium]|nr:hypothetical protein [Chitinophagaceae bacterium]